jgi:dihydroorotate dehydrogenase
MRYKYVQPLLTCLPAETAHGLAIRALKAGLVPRGKPVADPALSIRLWGHTFANPVGLAAGFDKQAEVMVPMLAQGFGFVEIGSVTPQPQPGNPKPRLFRLSEDEGVINRLGFNSEGMDVVARNLAAFRAKYPRGTLGVGPLGVNLGKNKDSTDAAADYAAGTRRLVAFADYLVLNISSPNTPGLRALQDKADLVHLLTTVRAALAEADMGRGVPLLVKIAPDLTEADLADIAETSLAGLADGLIIGNTTITRPADLKSAERDEAGGLSGKPLFALATRVLGQVYRLTQGRVPLIGVGGVGSAADAYEKIRAGASLVQLYSALVFRGPELVGEINRGLVELLRRDGFASVAEAVGAAHRA